MTNETGEDAPASATAGRTDGAGTQALRLARRSGVWTMLALRRLWGIAKPLLGAGIQAVLALVIIFEEWGWRPLADLVGRLAQWKPWASFEYAIARLPPYAALFVFALPSLLLFPLKFAALFLVARGQFVLATLVFMAAKIVATALIARLFMLTQPALMQIGWFAWAYDRVMPWKEALTERVRASWPWRVAHLWKERLRRMLAAHWRRLRPVVLGMRAAALAAGAAAVRRVRTAVARIAGALDRF